MQLPSVYIVTYERIMRDQWFSGGCSSVVRALVAQASSPGFDSWYYWFISYSLILCVCKEVLYNAAILRGLDPKVLVFIVFSDNCCLPSLVLPTTTVLHHSTKSLKEMLGDLYDPEWEGYNSYKDLREVR